MTCFECNAAQSDPLHAGYSADCDSCHARIVAIVTPEKREEAMRRLFGQRAPEIAGMVAEWEAVIRQHRAAAKAAAIGKP